MTIVLPPVHPGEILRDEFLEPMGLSAGALARLLNVPRTRIERLVAEQTSLTPDTGNSRAILPAPKRSSAACRSRGRTAKDP